MTPCCARPSPSPADAQVGRKVRTLWSPHQFSPPFEDHGILVLDGLLVTQTHIGPGCSLQ